MEEKYFYTPSLWRQHQNAVRRRRLTRRLILMILIAGIFTAIMLYALSVRGAEPQLTNTSSESRYLSFDPCDFDSVECGYEKPKIKEEFWATVYGYSSTVDQTDSSPEITAANTHVRDGIVANNCLPFGTKVLMNGQEFIVEDRMSNRYGCDVFDRWFPTREQAKQWGRSQKLITILTR